MPVHLAIVSKAAREYPLEKHHKLRFDAKKVHDASLIKNICLGSTERISKFDTTADAILKFTPSHIIYINRIVCHKKNAKCRSEAKPGLNRFL